MKRIECFGIIPVRQVGKEWEILFVKHFQGHWSFPKGHSHFQEKPQATAKRELEEETGLNLVRFFDIPPFEEKYRFFVSDEEVDKTVLYFLAYVQGTIVRQQEEIMDARWVALDQGEKLATFAATQKLCREVQRVLEKL